MKQERAQQGIKEKNKHPAKQSGESKKTKPDWEKLTEADIEKLEIAQELGLLDKIIEGGYGNLSAQESGRIGGIIGRRRRRPEDR